MCISMMRSTMRWAAGAGVLVVVAALLAVALIPPARNELPWRLARLRDTARAYQEYADAAHKPEADQFAFRRRMGEPASPHIPDSIFYLWMRWRGETDDLLEYLETLPKGRHVDACRQRLEQLIWTTAERTHTVASYQEYLDRFDTGSHAAAATTRQRSLQSDDTPFRRVAAAGTSDAWADFLHNFRGHRRSGEALAAYGLADPNNVFALVKSGRLQLTMEGDEIFRVLATTHRLVKEDLAISIPPGAYLQSGDHRVADMIATHGAEISLTSDGYLGSRVAAASASMRRHVGGVRQRFRILPTPPNPDLARLVAYFCLKLPTYRLRQAAIWAITDNASYEDLQKYVTPLTGADYLVIEDEDREFDAGEAVNTLMILDAAGLDVHNFALWRDRQEIFWQLVEEDVDGWQWLREMDAEGLGRDWNELHQRMLPRVAATVTTLLPVLKRGRPEFELSASGKGDRHVVAWLGWYLRQQGVDVDVDPPEISTEASVFYDEGLYQQAEAMATLASASFDTQAIARNGYSISLRPAAIDIQVLRHGAHEFVHRQRLENEMHRLLRWNL